MHTDVKLNCAKGLHRAEHVAILRGAYRALVHNSGTENWRILSMPKEVADHTNRILHKSLTAPAITWSLGGEDFEAAFAAVASRAHARKYTEVDALLQQTFKKKASAVMSDLGLAKKKSGTLCHGSVYEVVFPNTEKGKAKQSEPV